MASYSALTVVSGTVITSAWGNNVRDSARIDCTSTTRPSTPVDGMIIHETDTDRYASYNAAAAQWSYFDGTGQWHSYTPSIVGDNGIGNRFTATISNGVRVGRFRYIAARTIAVQASWTVGNADSGYNFNVLWGFTLPTPFREDSLVESLSRGMMYDNSANIAIPLYAVGSPWNTNEILLHCDEASSTYTIRRAVDWSGTTQRPFRLDPGDFVMFGAIYETAS